MVRCSSLVFLDLAARLLFNRSTSQRREKERGGGMINHWSAAAAAPSLPPRESNPNALKFPVSRGEQGFLVKGGWG